MRKAFYDIFISKTSKYNAFSFYLLYFGVFKCNICHLSDAKLR